LRLRAYPEGTAGAIMTTEIAKLAESLTARQALEELSHQAEHLETIYYLYVVDDEDHLKGVVSARQLVSNIGKTDIHLGELMEPDLIAAYASDDQEEVAKKVADYDLLAIPVVDGQRRLVGIITHDDVIDVVRDEAAEDAQRIAGVAPLEESFLETSFLSLSWKRGIWLTILFFTAMFTASALRNYEHHLRMWMWLQWFLPLIMSSGGNSGNQSATLVITALSRGEITVNDWLRIVLREIWIGVLLGGCLAILGFIIVWLITDQTITKQQALWPLVVPITLVLVVTCGAVAGAMLPLMFKRLGLDPALMSNPFVAGLSDILAIIIYLSVAMLLLTKTG
jgi:magnesium transporter